LTHLTLLRLPLKSGGEHNARSAYPNPTVGAVLVAQDGTILGTGFSDYNTNAIRSVIESAGLEVSPMTEWVVSWPASAELRQKFATSTLYVTLEPSCERRGSACPPMTELIEKSGIPRVVIGSPDPIPERRAKGAAALNAAGIRVTFGTTLVEECDELIQDYVEITNSKFQRMARKHYELFGRPLGFLHCSVIESDDVEAFARQGNAFGKSFGGSTLSYRNFGSYELAPPPDMIWADEESEEEEDGTMIAVDFEEEGYRTDEMKASPVMPWYDQADAVVATFPRQGNGPPDDDSIAGRLTGLRWLATHGCRLPAGVQRILVLDATDLKDLPLTNDDPNLPPNFDIEAFWAGKNRKPTRIILRRGENEAAQAAAKAAAAAAKRAAEAAAMAAAAIESGDAVQAAEAAIECQKSAQASAEFVLKQLKASTELRRKLESKGVVIEVIEGGEPIDVMKHLGERNGLHSVVWRAGCWGERGVKAIVEGAFQWVSAHLTVHASGGKFWQLMMAENAVQAACGPRSRVKVFADQEDMSLEYCDEDVDNDCVLAIDGRPVRHVRLDCRVALVEEGRPREFMIAKTQKINRKILVEEAPWFL
jgi:pyrimidine deaminase RibD-like protein